MLTIDIKDGEKMYRVGGLIVGLRCRCPAILSVGAVDGGLR